MTDSRLNIETFQWIRNEDKKYIHGQLKQFTEIDSSKRIRAAKSLIVILTIIKSRTDCNRSSMCDLVDWT